MNNWQTIWRAVVVTLLLLAYNNFLFALNPSFVKYDIDMGLSNNTVRCIVQDSYGFMWFGTEDGLSRFDGRKFVTYNRNDKSDGALGNSSIYSLLVKDKDHLWVGTGQGVYIYNMRSDSFTKFEAKTQYDINISSSVYSISSNGENQVWFGTDGQGLFMYDEQQDVLSQNSMHGSIITSITPSLAQSMIVGSELGGISEYTLEGDFKRTLIESTAASKLADNEATAIYSDGDVVWAGMGLMGLNKIQLHTQSGEVEQLSRVGEAVFNAKAIVKYAEDTLLVGTDNGLFLVDTRNGIPKRVKTDLGYHQAVNALYKDEEGGVWVATQYGGVDFIPRLLKSFESFLSTPTHQLGKSTIVNCFHEDKFKNIWIGTKDGGLLYVDGETGKELRDMSSFGPIPNIQCIESDGDYLWVGAGNSGLFKLNLRTGATKRYVNERGASNTISDNSVLALFKSSSGTLYVGNHWGLNIYNPRRDDFRRETRTTNQAYITDILEDRYGNIWFASYLSGLFRYNPRAKGWNSYSYNENNINSINNNKVVVLHEDQKGRIWIGTESGLCYYDYDQNKFFRLDSFNTQLADVSISSIEEDDKGHLWISTNMGLICYNTDEAEVVNCYFKTDGLQSNQFNPRASLRASDGELYFGGINGYNRFLPSRFEENKYLPKTVITEMYINNSILKVRDDGENRKSKLEESVLYTEGLKLNSKQNSISLSFATLSYQAPYKNKYRYKLDGWDNDWTETYDNKATYNNLPAGKYKFIVRGTNNDGFWRDEVATVNIRVLLPFYRTGTAFLIYILIIAVIVHLILRQVTRRHRAKLRAYAVEQEKKSYKSKINFFTNLAHEIRTPLTLIKVPLETIRNSGDGSSRTKSYLKMMDKNVDDLLVLINQLLDFRKTEETEYNLNIQSNNLSALILEQCERFQPIVKLNDIELEIDIPQEPIIYNVDKDAVVKIVNNLLSNASKYAKSKIEVSLKMKDDQAVLSVSDDGPGINESDRQKIFNTFYQSSNSLAGTGIGLPLVKLLVEKHRGAISVFPSASKGAEFEITLPRLETTPLPQTEEDIIVDDVSFKDGVEIEPEYGETTVLVVEDNVELCEIMAEIISKYYSVLTAQNGKQALDVLEEDDVDVIVTDLMMPQMDGYQLCEFVKSDMRFSHIPVIQVTAKTTMEDRIKGLEFGADAYIEKPFSSSHLITQISNLIENRRILRDAYRGQLFDHTTPQVINPSSKDSEFIEKLNEEILQNLQSENFYIDQLAESLFMSRSSFYRKIKTLFDMSPNEYLRAFRLNKAAEMLRDGDKRVSEIYMLVGFNSLSYFSTSFKEHFGMTSTEYIASFQDDQEQVFRDNDDLERV